MSRRIVRQQLKSLMETGGRKRKEAVHRTSGEKIVGKDPKRKNGVVIRKRKGNKGKKDFALEAKLHTKALISELQSEKRQKKKRSRKNVEVLKKLGTNSHMDSALSALKRRKR